jgi:hypothetical protein
MRSYSIQLANSVNGHNISTSGGVCYVAESGGSAKVALQNDDGTTLANPIALTDGHISFNVADTVASVDLYIQAPSGHFVVAKGVSKGGDNEIFVDVSNATTLMVLPFAIGDTTANTETDTGFDLPDNAAVIPAGVGVHVGTADATETIDVGILSSESGGNADGFVVGLSVAAADTVIAGATMTAGGTETYFSSCTLGVALADFLAGADSAGDVGSYNPKAHVSDGTAKSISYTLSTGTDTAEGFIIIPVQLPVASL